MGRGRFRGAIAGPLAWRCGSSEDDNTFQSSGGLSPPANAGARSGFIAGEEVDRVLAVRRTLNDGRQNAAKILYAREFDRGVTLRAELDRRPAVFFGLLKNWLVKKQESVVSKLW